MNAQHRVHPVLALGAGYVFGVGCVYAAVWTITQSSAAAITFSFIPAAFFLPVVIVFSFASARVPSPRPGRGGAERRQADVAIAVCYVFSLIPFWFAAVGFLEGRLLLGFALLAGYALMAAIPLRRLFRARIARNVSRGGRSLSASDGGEE